MRKKNLRLFKNPILVLTALVSVALIAVASAVSFRALATAPDGWTNEDDDCISSPTADYVYLDGGSAAYAAGNLTARFDVTKKVIASRQNMEKPTAGTETVTTTIKGYRGSRIYNNGGNSVDASSHRIKKLVYKDQDNYDWYYGAGNVQETQDDFLAFDAARGPADSQNFYLYYKSGSVWKYFGYTTAKAIMNSTLVSGDSRANTTITAVGIKNNGCYTLVASEAPTSGWTTNYAISFSVAPREQAETSWMDSESGAYAAHALTLDVLWYSIYSQSFEMSTVSTDTTTYGSWSDAEEVGQPTETTESTVDYPAYASFELKKVRRGTFISDRTARSRM